MVKRFNTMNIFIKNKVKKVELKDPFCATNLNKEKS
jgi:hypothetical protein